MDKVLYRPLIRFVVRSDERLNPEYGRSTIGAERPILLPKYIVSLYNLTLPLELQVKSPIIRECISFPSGKW